jgi:pSer/pThr/pTyr-binding forkhead associated (FHA) protein
MPQFALRFISGKYQGGEFPIRMNREIIIGRGSDLDMVLVEDMVSRRHAKISTMGGQITIEDMGSTNGTFVNGEKVRRIKLKEGDRILVGTSIIKLVAVEGPAVSDVEAKSRLQKAAAGRRPSTSGRPMSGTIDEIPLPDLLQLLSQSRKSGVLALRGSSGFGKIYLREGRIYYASIDDSFDLSPTKAIFRLLTWDTGAFELQPPDDKEFLEEVNESTEALLMEGMRQMDEMDRLKDELPESTTMYGVCSPLVPPLKELSPEALDVLQLVHNYAQIQTVLDKSPFSDLDTFMHLINLIHNEFIGLLE